MLKKCISVFISFFIILNVISIIPCHVSAETSVAISYKVGSYTVNDHIDGTITAEFDGYTFEYDDSFEPFDSFDFKLGKMKNQNVVYELHNGKIAYVYSMDEVLYPQVTISHSNMGDLFYKDGKFSVTSFDLQVNITPKLQDHFASDDLLWHLSESERSRLYLTLTGLNISTPYGADFGESGFAFWKQYQEEVNADYNDDIKINNKKTYSFTVNLRNDKVYNQSNYTLDFDITPSFDYGKASTKTDSIKISNLDAQAAAVEAKKETSPSGKILQETADALNTKGNLVTVSTVWNNFFTSEQSRQLDEFAYVWVCDLILAETIDYSQFDLKSEIIKEVQNTVFSKLGIDQRSLTKGEKLTGSVNLITNTKDGAEVLVNIVADLSSFSFWSSSTPYGVSGQLKLRVYNTTNGSQMGRTETVAVNYSDVNTFISNLQSIAKSTIFNIGTDVYGLSAAKTASKAASAITDGLITKALNSKSNCFSIVSHITNKQKSIIKRAISNAISDGLKDCNETVFKLLTTPSSSSKLHRFECPVNVKVYDNDNNLCASITDNQVDYTSDEVFAEVNGDTKDFYTTGDDYYFVVLGYDTGTMDYTIKEFNNDQIRSIGYNDVPVSNGCTYYTLSPQAENMSNVFFDLVDQNGNYISPSYGTDDSTIEVEIYETQKGKCGVNINYTLYDDGTLKIEGRGEMYDYDRYDVPWYNYRDTIWKVELSQGITSIGDYSFYDCFLLTNLSMGGSVTSIGGSVFSGCTSLQSVTIPDSVTSIGDSAFNRCTSLQSVTIPDSITSIGSSAFSGCTSLQSITIPGFVTSVNSYTFSGCTSLQSITIPDSVTSIGNSAFSGCTSLQTVTIPDSVTSIGDSAFNRCTSLQSVTIPDSITSIGSSAFSGCTSLQSITIPGFVTSVNSYTFSGCTSLQSITIPDSVTSIGYSAFSGCTSLQTVTIPDSVTRINSYAFNGCSVLTDVHITDVAAWLNLSFDGYHSNPLSCNDKDKSILLNEKLLTDVIIPGTISEIRPGAFYKCTSIKSITIPDSVASIGDSAFSGCTSLQTVTIPDSVTKIYSYAFYGCSALTDVHITDVVAWLNLSFDGSRNNPLTCNYNDKSIYLNGILLTDVIIPGTISEIRQSAFYKCTSIKSITIPDSVASIGYSAFSGCTSLQTVTIPDSVTSISSSTFSECTSLQSITIPDSVTSIGDYTFNGCSALTDVHITDVAAWLNLSLGYNNNPLTCNGKDKTLYLKGKLLTDVIIPGTISEIRRNAFYKCASIKSITIPDSVASIGYSAFSGCTSLQTVTIPDSVTSIGDYTFNGCSALTDVNITDVAAWLNLSLDGYNNDPLTCNDNDKSIFLNGELLTDVIIPGTISEIRKNAFYKCTSIKSITIPDSVTNIYSNAFNGCSALTDVHITDVAAWLNLSLDGYNNNPLSCNSKDKNLYLNEILLTDVIIPGTISEIRQSAFYKCTSIKSITIPDSVTSISSYTFSGCTSLQSVTIPDSVTSIGNSAFSGCTSLQTVTIPDSVTSIGDDTFNGCSALTDVHITDVAAWLNLSFDGSNNNPLACNEKDKSLYLNDELVTNVVIPDSISTIKTKAFYKCSSIKSVTFPDSVTSVEYCAFYGCSSITDIYSSDVESWLNIYFNGWSNPLICNYKEKNLFFNNSLVTDLDIPESVSKITPYAFSNCSSLRSVTIPNSVTTIGNSAFYNCSGLKSIIIPNSISYIGNEAFEQTALDYVFYTGTEDEWNNIQFYEDKHHDFNGTRIFFNSSGPIAVESIVLDKTSLLLSEGDRTQINADVLPIDATDQTIEWVSSNPEIATVLYGEVSAKKTGSTIITAISSNGKKTSCEVTVTTEPQLQLGGSLSAVISKPGERVEYLYTPKQDMIITFSGKSEKGFWIYIDGSGSGNSSGFEMSKNCIVEAGQTYHLSVEMYEENETGTVDVSLRGGLINSISLGETVEAPLTGPYQSVFYRFVPDASMMIRFHSNEEGAKLSLNDEDAYSICSVTNSDLFCYVQEGEIYYLQVEQSEYSDKVKNHTVLLNEFDPVEIQKDKEELITVEDSRSKDYYKYIAESDMEICFCAFSDDAIGISLYDSDMYWLDSKGSYSKSCKITYDVKKGETYYFSIDYSNHYDQDHTGSVKILVRETEPTDAWSYTHNDDGTIFLTHYKGTDESVIVPLQIDGFSVSGLESCSFNKRVKHLTIPDGISNASITSGDLYSVSLGKSICEFSCASWSNSNLQRFNVDAQNQYYKSIDGILLDKKTDFILQYPRGKNSTKYSIPEGVKGIGESAFSNNSYLDEVVFASSILSVDQSAFSGCSKLKNVQMDQNLEQINKFAFQSCVELESITIPSGVTKIEDNPFDGCLSLNTIQVDNANQQYSSADGVLFNKDKTKLLAYPTNKENEKYIVPDTVKAINKSAYSGNEKIHEVVLPNGLNIIGSQSFFNCINLEKVNIPYGLETIESSAFSQTAIKELDIPDSVTNIGNGAFARCEQLSSIRIPNGINKIEAFTFQSCDSLTDVSIPSSVTQIERYAFSYSPMLTNIEIPESVIYIGEYAFQGTDWLKRQPNEPLYINRVLYQFRGDVPKTYTIKEGTICVTANAFNDCYSLENIKAPDSLRYIGYNAFSETKWYDDQPNDTLIYIGRIAYQYKCSSENGLIPNSPKTIRLKSDTLAIAERAFSNCYAVEQINIPDSLLHIGYQAFFNCIGLKKLFIPQNVITIGDDALGYANGGYYGITIYGYPGTIAETYSKENDVKFVPLTNHTLTDTDTSISVTLVDEAILSITEITDNTEITESLPQDNIVYATYDIVLKKDGTNIQPLDKVTVSIPCRNKSAKVYRVEKDGTLTDMRAVYQNDYMVFTTTHFSVYVITVPDTITPFILGDVDGNREIEIVDATWIQRDVALITIPFVINKESADIDKDGEVTVMDASLIQKHLAELKSSIQIGNELT